MGMRQKVWSLQHERIHTEKKNCKSCQNQTDESGGMHTKSQWRRRRRRSTVGTAEHGEKMHIKSFELHMGWDGNNSRTEQISPGGSVERTSQSDLGSSQFFTSASVGLSKQYLQTWTTCSQSWGAVMSPTCTTCSDCAVTSLTHVQAFMTLWASFYSFIMMWTKNTQKALLWCRGIIPCLLYKLKCPRAEGKQIWTQGS